MSTTATNALAWPLAMRPRTADEVWSVAYPDFVAMVNQTNVMPGAFATLSTWAIHSRMDARSTLLDVACTTGFTSRELARLTRCAAVGFDLSADAVALARYNHHTIDPALRLQYTQADGETFDPQRTFSHIAVGAGLGFFPDPPAMVARLTRLLDDGGYLLASPFWCDHPLPADVAALRREVFGITSPMETRAQARSLFRGLDVLHQEDHTITLETDAEIELYCLTTINRACAQAGIEQPDVRQAMIDRLQTVKRATNRMREHQRYSVRVLRLDRGTHPGRFVEAF